MKNLDLSVNDTEKLALVARALGSDVRIRIMQLLGERSMSIVELAQAMNAPLSTISNNVVLLEEAELIRTERRNGVRGVMKLCSRKRDQIHIDLEGQEQRQIESHFQYMPIGHYIDCLIVPTCGMAGSQSNIGTQDDTALFYEPEHFDAQLLCSRKASWNTGSAAGTPWTVSCIAWKSASRPVRKRRITGWIGPAISRCG